MTDKPIRFSGAMVRAILEGRKTQTRWVIPFEMTSGANPEFTGWRPERVGRRDWQLIGGMGIGATFRIPYAPGDRLWAREAWRTSPAYDDLKPSDLGGEESIFYEAGGTWESWGWGDTGCVSGGRLRASMHMPRWASRLTLTVTDVRVQRLQEIRYEDVLAEGVETLELWQRRRDACINHNIDCGSVSRDSFRELWDSLNAKPKPVGGKITTHYVSYPWDGEPRTETYRGKPHHIHPNPWVCAMTFTVHRCNIDQKE